MDDAAAIRRRGEETVDGDGRNGGCGAAAPETTVEPVVGSRAAGGDGGAAVATIPSVPAPREQVTPERVPGEAPWAGTSASPPPIGIRRGGTTRRVPHDGGEPVEENLLALVPVRRGHFRLESGYHGEMWLDLDALLLRPGWVRRFATELARRLAAHGVEAVCGPLVGGAFLAQMVAAELGATFVYAERFAAPRGGAAAAVAYRVPGSLRGAVRGRRVAVVDDAIDAGSAVGATLAELRGCGAEPVAIGALLVLGSAAAGIAAEQGVPLEGIAFLPNRLWAPAGCPLCAAGVPSEDAGA